MGHRATNLLATKTKKRKQLMGKKTSTLHDLPRKYLRGSEGEWGSRGQCGSWMWGGGEDKARVLEKVKSSHRRLTPMAHTDGAQLLVCSSPEHSQGSLVTAGSQSDVSNSGAFPGPKDFVTLAVAQ